VADFRNSPFMFTLGGIVAAFVTTQCLVFIVRAWREGRRIGLSAAAMKKTLYSSSLFSVVPSIAILIAVLTLSGALGLALPWIRLSVIGAITYELPAAETAAQAFGTSTKVPILDPTVFSAIAWAMSAGTAFNMLIVVFFAKSIQGGINKIKTKDEKWTSLLITAMFMGLISAFLGSALGGGLVSILTLLTSALIMGIFGLLIKKAKIGWLESYAMPVSMVGGMASAILYSSLLGGAK
jgi:hypothetical protein